jgi:hypothetical protein
MQTSVGSTVLTIPLGSSLALVSGATTQWRVHRWQFGRERAATMELAGHYRQERFEQSQRDALIALQDAAADLNGTDEGAPTQADQEWQDGGWPVSNPDDLFPDDWEDAHGRLIKLRSRVFDGKTRDLAKEIRDLASAAMYTSEGRVAMWDWIQLMRPATGTYTNWSR